jgi:hypothetical protein
LFSRTAREGEIKTLTFAIPLTVVLSNILTTGDVHPSKAQGANTFVIAATSGYAVEDCLGEGGEKFGQENGSGVLVAGRRPDFIACGRE